MKKANEGEKKGKQASVCACVSFCVRGAYAQERSQFLFLTLQVMFLVEKSQGDGRDFLKVETC